MTEIQIVDWIIAIELTIKMWEDFLITMKKKICPLCMLAGHPKNARDPKCDNCIHTSEFGQGIICFKQKSFNNIMMNASNWTLQKIAVRQRIGHLRRLADKLSRYLATMNPENTFILIR